MTDLLFSQSVWIDLEPATIESPHRVGITTWVPEGLTRQNGEGRKITIYAFR